MIATAQIIKILHISKLSPISFSNSRLGPSCREDSEATNGYLAA